MLDKLTSQDFERYLHDPFCIFSESSLLLEVELVSVTELGEPPQEEDKRHAFSLVFRSPLGDSYLPQQIYTLEHQALGKMDLFLVPIGPDPVGMCYEVIFN